MNPFGPVGVNLQNYVTKVATSPAPAGYIAEFDAGGNPVKSSKLSSLVHASGSDNQDLSGKADKVASSPDPSGKAATFDAEGNLAVSAQTVFDPASPGSIGGTTPVPYGNFKNLSVNGTLGQFMRTSKSGTTAAMSGATATIDPDLPAQCNILGVILVVTTEITGATSWSASFTGGNTAAICTEQAVADYTTVKSYSGGDVDGATEITITAVGSNFTGGVIVVTVFYEYFDTY
jgi:hypothetical protein